MAKIFDKMKDLMFGEYEDDDDYYEDEYVAAPAPVRETPSYGLRDASADYSAPVSTSRKSSRGANNNPQIYSVNTNVTMQVVIIKPECYEDAQEICDQIKTKRPVVVNLEKLDKDTARKIVDFLSGAVYALDGSMQKVSNGILLLVPYTMGIMGDFSDEIKTHALFDFF